MCCLTFLTTLFPVTTTVSEYLISAGELESPVDGGDFLNKCSFFDRQRAMFAHVICDLFDQ